MRRVLLSAVLAFVPVSSGLRAQQETDPRGNAAAVAAVRYFVQHHLTRRESIGVSGLAASQVQELTTSDRRVRPFEWKTDCGAAVSAAPRARAACGLRWTDTHIEVLKVGKESGSKRKVLVAAYMPSEGMIRSDDGIRHLELEIELTESEGRWTSARVVGGRIP